MKSTIVAITLFILSSMAPAVAAEQAGSDAIFHQRFIPADETTELHQDILEWRIQRCILGQDGVWFIEFDLVGHEDAAMESYVLQDGNQPLYVEGQGWVPTFGFDIDNFCLSYTS